MTSILELNKKKPTFHDEYTRHKTSKGLKKYFKFY